MAMGWRQASVALFRCGLALHAMMSTRMATMAMAAMTGSVLPQGMSHVSENRYRMKPKAHSATLRQSMAVAVRSR